MNPQKAPKLDRGDSESRGKIACFSLQEAFEALAGAVQALAQAFRGAGETRG